MVKKKNKLNIWCKVLITWISRETDDYDQGGNSDEEGERDYHSERREADREKKERSSIIMKEFKKRKGAQVSEHDLYITDRCNCLQDLHFLKYF